MKASILLTLVLAGGLIAGFKIGRQAQNQRDLQQISILEKKVERFQDPYIFHKAMQVSRITHAPLYQVLTGHIDPYQKEN